MDWKKFKSVHLLYLIYHATKFSSRSMVQRELKKIIKKIFFTYLGSSVSSTKTDINTWLAKVWTTIGRLSVIWKADLTDKMKCTFFPSSSRVDPAVRTATTQECCEHYWTSHGGSTPQSSSCMATYHPSGKLSKLDKPDMQNTAGEELISDVLLWTSSHGRAKAG